MRFLRVLAFLCLFASLAGAQSTTVTGTIKNLDQTAATSGQVTFELQPGIDTTMSGIARFTPSTVTCTITAAGLVKALDGVSACTITQNTALSPANTSYKVCIMNAFAPGQCFIMYATTSSVDITTVTPTPAQMPAYNLVDTFSAQSIAGNKTFTGNITFGGTLTLGAVTLGGNLNMGSNSISTTGLTNLGDGTMCATCTFKWGSSGTTSPDLGLSRSAANTLAVGTGAQGNTGGTIAALNAVLGSTGVLSFNADTGISRDSAASISIGNGIQGNKSGTVKAANVTLGKTDGTLPAQFTNDTTGGFLFTTNGAKTWEINNSGNALFFGATSGSTTVQATAVASGTLTLPAATGTLARTAGDTFTTTTLTSPTINTPTIATPSFTAMCNNNNAGCKAQRFGATCSTAAAAGAGCTTAFTWTAQFSDANYTVTCDGMGATNSPTLNISSVSASQVTIQVIAISASAASYSSVGCIAIHD